MRKRPPQTLRRSGCGCAVVSLTLAVAFALYSNNQFSLQASSSQEAPVDFNNHSEQSTTKVDGSTSGQLWSSVDLPDGAMHRSPSSGNVHVFHNVRLGKRRVTLYKPASRGRSDRKQYIAPFLYHIQQPMQQIDVVFKSVAAGEASPLERCKWNDRPAIVFDIPYVSKPGQGNPFHILNDGVMSVYQTLRQAEPFISHRRLNTTGPSNAPLSSNDMSCPRVAPGQPPLLLALRSKSFTSRWQYLLNAISPHQALLDEMSGTCFKNLIIGGSRALNFYFHNTGFERERSDALNSFQKFIACEVHFHATESILASSDGHSKSVIPLATWPRPRDGGEKPLVILASRPPQGRRAVLNEPELMGYILRTWDVELVTTTFNGSLWEAIDLLHRSTLFIGMHGAAMTNAMFLQQDAVMVQLFPWGWQLQPNRDVMLRDHYYRGMAIAANAAYFSWVNPDAEKAFLKRLDFERAGVADKFQSHPSAALQKAGFNKPDAAYWMYQDTLLDMPSLALVLDAAFKAAGVKRKG